MIYFLSDVHLGSLLIPDQREHERKVVRLLDQMKKDATAIYLLGDIFDFWFEYTTVVPKGHTRLFGKIAELTDAGIEVHFFIGNHDLWTFGYFEKELGMKVHYRPEVVELYGKRFYLAHGDGLSTGDAGFSVLRKVFHSRVAQR
ncbi:MAG: UDP-2,3-diacylglucosamine diphosphatase, partial [Bacteroidales bacterium]|nr:UDP-2,3-diacylglucosamine diphosphatase [Bacteroidales bacterium]